MTTMPVTTYGLGGLDTAKPNNNVVSTDSVPVPDSVINMQTLLTSARTALNNNLTYLAIAAPTTAQAVAQVAALTRQTNAIIRLLVGQLDSIAGT